MTGGLGEYRCNREPGTPGHDIDAVLAILSRPDDDDLADIVELVAKICDAEAAGITIQRDDEYHVPITYGIAPFVSPSTDTFCQHTMGTDGRLHHRGRPRRPALRRHRLGRRHHRLRPLLRLGPDPRPQRGDGRAACA